MVSVQAFIDDSRSDVGEQRLVLAGYVNTAEKWARFSDAWYAELRAPPSIDYFKMVEAAGLRGQFGGWSVVDRDNKVADLARIIRHWKPVSIHSSVSQKQVREHIHPIAPYGIADAYGYAFQALIIPLAIHQSQKSDLLQVPIDFIFDEQEGLGERARQLYQAIRADQPRAVRAVLSSDPLFRNDKLVMPLQAADMLAWHIRRHFEQEDRSRFPVPKFLLGGEVHSCVDLEEEHILKFAEGFAKVPGAAAMVGKARWNRHRKEMKALGLAPFTSPGTYRRQQFINRARKLLSRFIGR